MIESIATVPEPTATTYPLPASLLHDLRTPLNQIIGYSELVMDQARDEGLNAFMPDISKVRSAGGELLKIINENFTSSQPAQAPHSATTDWPEAFGKVGSGITLSNGELTELVQGKVLVVDDGASNRDILWRRLNSQGYAVATAENGRIAIEMLRETEFDLVLLDIMMPEMDGFEVLRLLKSDERLKHIPVIMISALSETDSALRCIEMGAEDYLPKPFDPTLLRARTVACLDRKRGHDKEIQFTNELQQSYKRAKELEQMRDDLTNMIVRDLRSPLTSIISGLQTLTMAGEMTERQQELLDISLSGGGTLLGMINDLLDINKMECGALELDREEVHAEDIVERACKQINTLAASKNVELTTAVGADLPTILGDKRKLVRTVVNLLSNAVKFTSPGGNVRVAAAMGENGRSLLLSVSNSGEGIPATEFGRIFDKFGQIETLKAGRTHSTGLGLTLCKLVVEAHGGRIWVESEMEVGSSFFFTLPLEN